MCDVYRAVDEDTGLTVALKLFRLDDRRDIEAAKQTCEAEMAISQAVDHPNIIKAFSSGEVGDQFYFTMEFVEGESLGKRLRNGPELTLEEKLEILMQAALGLGAAHRLNIIHRDIKPGNIMITYDAGGNLMVKIADFGIAADMTETELEGKRKVPGTPKYLAPEVIRGKGIDGRADIFALGITAYEVLTGTDPFEPEDGDYLKANLKQHPKAASSIVEGLPPEIDLLLAKMLAKNPDDRYTAASLARDVARVQTSIVMGDYPTEYEDVESAFYVGEFAPAGEPSDSNKKLVYAGGGVAAVIALVAALFFFKPSPPSGHKPSGNNSTKQGHSTPGKPVAKAKAVPAPKPINLATSPQDTIILDIELAKSQAAEGRFAEAKAIYARLLEGKRVTEELRSQLRGYVNEIDDQLAQKLYAQAEAANRAKDRAKCRALLKQIKNSFPRFRAKADLLLSQIELAEAKERERVAERRRNAGFKLESLVAEANYLLASTNKDYKAVIGKYLAFAKEYSDLPAAKSARKEAMAVAARWQKDLKGNPKLSSTDVAAYFKAMRSFRGKRVRALMQRGLPSIFMALAQSLGKRGKSAEQKRVLQRIAKNYPKSPEGKLARQMLAAQPKPKPKPKPKAPSGPAYTIGSELVESFDGGLQNPRAWVAINKSPNMKLDIGGGKAAVSCQYTSERKGIVGLSTISFGVRSFDARLTFRLPRVQRITPSAKVMLVFELKDQSGKAFRVYFDGRDYGLGMVVRSGGGVMARSVVQARGDEDRRPRTLRLVFDKDACQVQGYIDGDKIGSYMLTPTDLRLRFFVSAAKKISFDAQFQSFQCKFSE